MKKTEQKQLHKRTIIIRVILVLIFVAYTIFVVTINWTKTASVNLENLGHTTDSLIAYDMPAYDVNLRTSKSLPPADNSGLRDLRFYDLSGTDLSNNYDELMLAIFSSHTMWPDNLPDGYSPEKIMEFGMNPGLGLRELHSRGITGQGVGVAVIDFNLLAGHEQYAERLRVYELYRTVNKTAVMHSAVASIAVGKDMGVAPGATLYHIATMYGTYLPPFTLINYNNIVTSIERILEMNTHLPDSEKIRVISISRGFRESELDGRALKEVIELANESGVFVITCSPIVNFDFELMGLGRNPMADPDDVSSYSRSLINSKYQIPHNALLVPTDSRTTAGFTGESEYIFYRQGGSSWAAPWLAGMYALCVQVYPEITPELFVDLAFETGDAMQAGTIINPARLIERLEK